MAAHQAPSSSDAPGRGAAARRDCCGRSTCRGATQSHVGTPRWPHRACLTDGRYPGCSGRRRSPARARGSSRSAQPPRRSGPADGRARQRSAGREGGPVLGRARARTTSLPGQLTVLLQHDRELDRAVQGQLDGASFRPVHHTSTEPNRGSEHLVGLEVVVELHRGIERLRRPSAADTCAIFAKERLTFSALPSLRHPRE